VKTNLCHMLGIEHPIIAAPMGPDLTGPDLVAAVSNAGRLGTLQAQLCPPPLFRQEIRRVRALTDRPFGVNLILHFPVEDHVAVCLEERVPVLSFFWGDPTPYVGRAHAAGVKVFHQVGSVAEAQRAAAAGIDWRSCSVRSKRSSSARKRRVCWSFCQRAGAAANNALAWLTTGGMSMTLTPALSPISAKTTAGTAHRRRRPRLVSSSTAWFIATATMAAASESVTETWVLSRKKTKAVTASTAKQTVKTVLSVTWDAGRGAAEMGIAPLYRSLRENKCGAKMLEAALRGYCWLKLVPPGGAA